MRLQSMIKDLLGRPRASGMVGVHRAPGTIVAEEGSPVIDSPREERAKRFRGARALAWTGVAVRTPIALLCAAILLIPLQAVSLPLDGAGITPSEGMFCFAGGGWALWRLSRRKWPFSASPLGWPLALLVAAILPSFAVAFDTTPVVKTLVMWSFFLLAYQMVVTEARAEDVRAILLALAVSAAIAAVIAIVQTAGSHQFTLQEGGRVSGRATGPFDHPDLLGDFLALAIPVALALGIGGPRKLRPIALTACVISAVGLALSFSRGGLLGAAGGVAVLLAWRPFRRVALAVAVGAVLLVAASFPLVGKTTGVQTFVDRIQATGNLGDDPRFFLWRKTLTIIGDHPLFGVGENQYQHAARQYGVIDPASDTPFEHAHSIPLTIAAELGAVGFAAFVWLVVALVRVVSRALRRSRGEELVLAFAVTAGLVALALDGLVDYPVRLNAIAALAFILAGCAVVLAREREPRLEEPAAAPAVTAAEAPVG